MSIFRVLGFVLMLLLSACTGDAQITVKGNAKGDANCVFNRYEGEKRVETIPVAGNFEEIYAVSMATPMKVEIVCAGVVVAEDTLRVFKGNVDFGEVPRQ